MGDATRNLSQRQEMDKWLAKLSPELKDTFAKMYKSFENAEVAGGETEAGMDAAEDNLIQTARSIVEANEKAAARADMLKDAERIGTKAGKEGGSRDFDFNNWVKVTGNLAEDALRASFLVELNLAYKKGYDKGVGDRPRYLGFIDGLIVRKAHAIALKGAVPTQAYEAGYKEGVAKRTELRERARKLGYDFVKAKDYPRNDPEGKISTWPEVTDSGESHAVLIEDLKDFYAAGKSEGITGVRDDGEGWRAKHPPSEKSKKIQEKIDKVVKKVKDILPGGGPINEPRTY